MLPNQNQPERQISRLSIIAGVVRKLRYGEKLGPAEIARRLGIGRASVYRVLGKKGA